jgi:hypothetical protein
MRRWFYRATFSLMVLSLPLSAQGHGGGGAHFASGGGHSFGGFSGHPSASASFRGGSFSHTSGSGVHVRPGNPYPRRGPYGTRYYYPRGVYYSYYGPYYGWYTDPFAYQNSSDDETLDSYADSYAPAPYAEDNGLQRDIQELNGKVDHLQADLEARNRPKTEEPETALVFRDQHVEEVRNYAIAGGNLWVLNEAATKKIPLTQLDLDATVKKNDERGVDFQLPEPAMSIMITR